MHHARIFFSIQINKTNRIPPASRNAIATTGAIADIYQGFSLFLFFLYTKHSYTEF
jgi:hypothetical protein